MRILVALIAVFMVSGAVGQMPTKAPQLAEAECSLSCPTGYSPRPICTGECKDPKTGKSKKFECKVTPEMAQKSLE